MAFRLAATADLHCRIEDYDRVTKIVEQINESADAVVWCGDLTDHGRVEEGRTLMKALRNLNVPSAAVLGNHDYETDAARDIGEMLRHVGVHVLDGDYIKLSERVGVAGTKGFAGGFGREMLQAFGEPAIKSFVLEAVNEQLKLESALGQLEADSRVVIMHYSPVAETTAGEPEGIRPYLGSSRMAIPLDRFGADAVFHGHAHRGALEGATPGGLRVFNVSMPLLLRHFGRAFTVVEL